MVSARIERRFTEQEYLALEAVASIKHEFISGDIVGMAGAELEHNRIVQNIRVELGNALAAKPCLVVGSDQRVKVEATGDYFYPDVVVTCEEPRLVDPKPRSLVNPQILIEVLSTSTEGLDLGDKWQAYQAIPTLTDYVIVASRTKRVQYYQRTGEGAWTMRSVVDGSIKLTGDIGLELARIYRLVKFDA